ncbi:MAG: HNH endonuclease [Bacilli bacterium]|nr:HNH endonuclease [Bacilli bacterium]
MLEEKSHPTIRIRARADGAIFVTGRWKSTGHWTFGSRHPSGYRSITLNHKTYLVHRLIAEAFFGNIPENAEVDHIDRDKSNNAVINLRICSHAMNMRNTSSADRHGKLTGTHKWENPKADKTEYHRIYRSTHAGAAATRKARIRQDSKRKKFYRKVHLNNGKARWLPIEMALAFRKLPAAQRTESVYFHMKQKDKPTNEV